MSGVTRTDVRMLIADSLRELARNKSLEKITVQHILDDCGIARQTFYNHFRDKYDLVNWIFKTKSDEVVRNYIDTESWGKVIKRILAIMTEYPTFYSSENNIGRQYKFLYYYSSNLYAELVKSRFGKEEMTDRLTISIDFNCHGSASMTKYWLEKGMKESPELVAERIYYGMPHDLKKFF